MVRGEAAQRGVNADRKIKRPSRDCKSKREHQEHGLFHLSYFENGPLEPGYTVTENLKWK